MRLHDRSTPESSAQPSISPAVRPRGRFHTLAGLVAVVALIVLSAGIFSHFATRGSSHPGTAAVTPHPACAPAQATATLPAHTILSAIAPLGTDDGWAVGGVSDPKHPESPPSALILHLRNCHWAPAGTLIPHAHLNAISMVSADEGWAVGVTMKLNTTMLSNGKPANSWDYDQPLVLHYTHGSWQTVTVTANPQTSAEKVKMVSANEGWMLLYDGKHPTTINGTGTLTYGYSLLHYQNGEWANVPMSFRKPSMVVSDLDARQPGEVWLIGEDIFGPDNSQPGFVARYSGGVWTPYAGAAIGLDASNLESISELSPTDVWVAGNGLYHFDGSRWTEVHVQGTSGISGNYQIGEIAMLSPTAGWAFPSFGEILGLYHQNQGILAKALRYDHGVWQWTTLQIRGASSATAISGFVKTSATQGWALGMQISSGDEESTVLLYYDAGNWGVVRQQP